MLVQQVIIDYESEGRSRSDLEQVINGAGSRGSPGSQRLNLSQQLGLTGVALHHLQQRGAQLRATARHAVVHQPRSSLVHLRAHKYRQTQSVKDPL